MKKVLVIVMLLFSGIVLPQIVNGSERRTEDYITTEVVFAEEDQRRGAEVGIIGRIGLAFALFSLVVIGTIAGFLLQKTPEDPPSTS